MVDDSQDPARNLGVPRAASDYLAFLDADDLVPRAENYLREHG